MSAWLLVSGWGCSTRLLEPLAERLASAANVELVTLGQLRRQAAEHDVGLSTYASGLVRWLVDRDERPILGGWSMGAVVALEAALAVPDHIHRLALIAPTLRFCQADDYPCGLPPSQLRALRLALRKQPQQTMQTFLDDCFQPAVPTEFQLDGAACVETDRSLLVDGLDYLRETDLRDREFSDLPPATVVHGIEDRVIPVSAGSLVAERLGAQQPWQVAGAGHAVAYTHAATVGERLLATLG